MGDSRKYAEWLSDVNWQSKRAKIIAHSAHKCSYCLNKALLENLHVGSLYRINNDINVPSKFLIEDIKDGYRLYIKSFITKNIINVVPIYKYKKLEKEYSYFVFYSIEERNVVAISKNMCDRYILDQELKLLSNPSQSNIQIFLNEKFLKEVNWDYMRGLHVHHKYYQENKKPWEYPENATITVCKHCHQFLHETEKIPFLDKNGRPISLLTPCIRCNGTGEIYEYKHIESGICFRCRGAKYDELF
jgi:5-methylcytosine-specific restriction endonuclease McrA